MGAALKDGQTGSGTINVDDEPSPDEEVRVDSFLVRVWRRGKGNASTCRGRVEHVQTRRRTLFVSLHRLPSILASYIGVSMRKGPGS